MFEDLVVIELASVLAGPLVGQFFAELGAKVIKVENPNTKGDVTRKWKLKNEDKNSDISAYFSSANWGKFSIAIDLKKDEGRNILYELVKKADVVIANYKPNDDVKLGVDYKTLSKINPKIIYGHITGYLKSNRSGFDALIQAESGFMYMNGYPECPPAKMPVALIDILTAHQLKEAILIALMERERSGKGKYIRISLFQSAIASLANQATNYLMTNYIPQRMGSEHPNIFPYGTIFKTKDGGEIVLAVGTDRQFRELCRILGIEEVAKDPRFSTNAERVKNREILRKILADEIAKWNKKELLKILNENNVPSGGINNMKEVFEIDEAKDMVIESPTAKGIRSTVFVRNSLIPPPHYAQHTEKILREFLGMSKEEIERLKREEVVD